MPTMHNLLAKGPSLLDEGPLFQRRCETKEKPTVYSTILPKELLSERCERTVALAKLLLGLVPFYSFFSRLRCCYMHSPSQPLTTWPPACRVC